MFSKRDDYLTISSFAVLDLNFQIARKYIELDSGYGHRFNGKIDTSKNAGPYLIWTFLFLHREMANQT